jgi:hypothetical protein
VLRNQPFALKNAGTVLFDTVADGLSQIGSLMNLRLENPNFAIAGNA